MATQPAFRATAIDHAHPAEQTCPYCEQKIPNDRVEEIRTRFESAQRRQATEMKTRMDAEFAAHRTQLEAAKKAEIAKIVTDNAAALEKQKAEALAQQSAAREEGKKLAEAELTKRIEAIAAEQAATKAKMDESEQRRLAAVTELTSLKEQQEAIITARTGEVRTAMEKNKVEEINGLKAQQAAETQTLSNQMAALQRRLDTAEGEGADVKLLELLKAHYPKDEFIPVNKGSGADLIHVIKNGRKICGRIVYDTRNRNAWNPEFATKLRDDMVTEKADHAILTSSKFPKGAQQVCHHDGVIVANPARVTAIAAILRGEVIRSHSQRVSAEDRDRKTAKLYDHITSDAFAKAFDSVAGNFGKLLKLDEDEKRAHDTMWRKRGDLVASSQRLHAKLREQIDGILSTSDTE